MGNYQNSFMTVKNSAAMLCGFFMLMAASSPAALNFTLDSPTLSVNGANQVLFSGTLSNTSPTQTIYLNDVQIGIFGTATNWLTAGTNTFFSNVPGILLPNETYADVIFSVGLAPAAPLGTYPGRVTVKAGSNILDTATFQSTQSFQVKVVPATLGLKISGTNLLISWQSPPSGSVLQQSTNLLSTNWLNLTNLPSTAWGTSRLTLPNPSVNNFYRLVYP